MISGIISNEISLIFELLFSFVSVTIPFRVPSSSAIMINEKSSSMISGMVSIIVPSSEAPIAMSVKVIDCPTKVELA